MSFYEKKNSEYNIESFKDVLESNKMSLTDIELALILNTLEYYHSHPTFLKFWGMIENHPVIHKSVILFINQNRDYTDLLKGYLDEKINLTSVEEILNKITNLLETYPYFLKNVYFQILAIQKTANAVGDSPDIFIAASRVKAFTLNNPEVDFTKIKDKMMVYSEIALLDKLDLQKITLKEIAAFREVTSGKLNEHELKDKRILHKYKSMMVLQHLFHTPGISAALLLQEVTPSLREELQAVIRNVLRCNLSTEYFQHILAAFANEEGSYQYPQLFAYLSKNADEEQLISFIKWTAKSLQLDHHYYRALKVYLKSHPRSIWKNKGAREELQQISTGSFRKLITEVQNETANPAIKFFKKRGIHLSFVLCFTLVAGSGLYLVYDLLTDNKEKAAASNTGTAGVNEQKKSSLPEPPLEPFIRWDSESPFVFTADGQQQQLTFGQGNPNGGKSLVLKDSQTVETSFDLIIESEVSPFDENGSLKEGYSLYHAAYDFDNSGNPEIVIMALSQTFESFVWVYSPISENGNISLRTDITVKGMSTPKLIENILELIGDQGQSEKYAYINQQFVKQ
ncbi:hypothetical protein [Neobacillus vireti]|uniref:hypothetical protein n=1 Tax=Neobacillus vireti TaxID=220686 RepID=UPI002FFE1219